jgi:arsenate reductase
MAKPLLYHNPRCSKSRGALDLITTRGVDAEVIQYLQAPPERATLERIVDALDGPPRELVRKDARFRELGLDAADYEARDAVVSLLLEHPELMERPVLLIGERAVIGRPPERVLQLLDEERS